MIVIASRPGQLGNLLIVYSNLLAYCREHGIRLFNPAFFEYNKYFKSDSWIKATINRRLYRVCYLLARTLVKLKVRNRLITAIHLDWEDKVDLDNGPLPELRSAVCFIQGWQFRGNSLLKKHGSYIREIFSPRGEHKKTIDSYFSQHVQPEAVIVGLHIRRGDYERFEEGRYYYSVEQYFEKLTQIIELFASQKVHFIISSNEPLKERLEELKEIRYSMAPGHELLDMYCLARCNYIAGPPSTYSMWASFYGKVPLHMIKDINRRITLPDFMIQETF
jgi:hypothetical protein